MPRGMTKNGTNKGWIKKGDIRIAKIVKTLADYWATPEAREKQRVRVKAAYQNGFTGVRGIKWSRRQTDAEKELHRQAMLGSKNPMWEGGITPEHAKIRNSKEYADWRIAIFRRDNFACIKCGDNTSGNLNADHIKPLGIVLHENNITTFTAALTCKALWDITNGQTLCIPCHKKTDTWGGRTGKVLKQLKLQPA